MDLTELLTALRQVASSRCLMNEVLLTDLIDLLAGFCSRDELQELLERGIYEGFVHCTRTACGVVVTFANLQAAGEMLDAETVLARIG